MQRSLLCGTAILAISPCFVNVARAQDILPEVGRVIAGDIGIDVPAGPVMVVRQGSDRGIIDWSSFSIGGSNRVHFDNGTGATLNRVTGGGLSRIDGRLTGTGSVFLINPSGIVIGPGGVVETGGSFIASTLDMDDADFLAGGDAAFRGDGGRIVNLGRVGVLGGDVALISREIENHGEILAPNGAVGLAVGREILLRDAALGEGLLSVRVGTASDRIEEAGLIAAASVELHAHGGNVYAMAGNPGGTINATGVTRSGGRILLTAGPGGTVAVDKTMRARAPSSSGRAEDGGAVFINAAFASLGGIVDLDGATGGSLTVDAGQVSLAGTVSARGLSGTGGRIELHSGGDSLLPQTALVDVSGASDGGTIRMISDGTATMSGRFVADGASGKGGTIDIGGGAVRLLSAGLVADGAIAGGRIRVGGEMGGGKALLEDHLPNSRSLAVSDSTVISASAKGPGGDGGEIILWADDTATVLGRIAATPGAATGAGGFIEVSAGEEVSLLTSAIRTGGGTLLIDPRNIIIQDADEIDQSQFILSDRYVATMAQEGIDAGDAFGAAVDGDGLRLVVGAPRDDGATDGDPDVGAVHLFLSSGMNFRAPTLIGTIGKGYVGGRNVNVAALDAGDAFGRSVSLDGNLLAIGAPGDDGATNQRQNSGAVYYYSFDTLDFRVPKLEFVIGEGQGRQGFQLGDFTFGGGDGPGSRLLAGDAFGYSVALDGGRLAVGAPGNAGSDSDQQTSGKVYLFAVRPERDRFEELLLDFEGNVEIQHIVQSGDAHPISILGRGYKNDKWTISPVSPGTSALDVRLDAGDRFGASVDWRDELLAIGAPGDDGYDNTLPNSGAVHLFSYDRTHPFIDRQIGTIGAGYPGFQNERMPALDQGDFFGSSVAFAGSRLMVGAPGDDGSGNSAANAGAVYVFEGLGKDNADHLDLSFVAGRGYSGQNVNGRRNITVDSLQAGDGFGAAVALHGDQLIVGAFNDDGAENDRPQAGAVHRLTFENGRDVGGNLSWVLSGTQSNNSRESADTGDMFGAALAIDNGRLAIGSPGDDGGDQDRPDAGAVYFYTFGSENFSDLTLRMVIGARYFGSNRWGLAGLEAGDRFGWSVALDQAHLFVGAPGDDGADNDRTDAGAVYKFVLEAAPFQGLRTSGVIGYGYPESGANSFGNVDMRLDPGDRFGSALGISGEALFVGAPGDDGRLNTGPESGAVHVFDGVAGLLGRMSHVQSVGGDYRVPLKNQPDTGVNVPIGIGDAFGASIAVNDSILVVGAPGDDGRGDTVQDAGALHVLRLPASRTKPNPILRIGQGYSGDRDVDAQILAPGDFLGRSVAISGNLIHGGAPGKNGARETGADAGAVLTFGFDDYHFYDGTLVNAIGLQFAGALVGGGQAQGLGPLRAGDNLGTALATHGQSLLVGASGRDTDGGDDTGAVFVMDFGTTRFGRTEWQARDALTDVGGAAATGDLFGWSVSMHDRRLVVGAPGTDGADGGHGNSGAVHMYTFDGPNYAGANFVGTIGKGFVGPGNINVPRLEAGDSFGSSVSLHRLGLAVGASGDRGMNDDTFAGGAVYLYSFNHWGLTGGVLRGILGKDYGSFSQISKSVDRIRPGSNFGAAVALNESFLAVGAPAIALQDLPNPPSVGGIVHTFGLDDGAGPFAGLGVGGQIGWGVQEVTKGSSAASGPTVRNTDAPVAVGDAFGASVALYNNLLAIGAPRHDGRPHLDIDPDNLGLVNDLIGTVVDSGAAFIYRLDRTALRDPQDLLTTLGAMYGSGNDTGVPLNPGDGFGRSIAIGPHTLIVGAPFDDGVNNDQGAAGAVYRFRFDDTEWRRGQLDAIIGDGYAGQNPTGGRNFSVPGLEAGDSFGHAVAWEGDHLVVGAPYDFGEDNLAPASGRVYRFTLARGGRAGGFRASDMAATPDSADYTISTETLEGILQGGTSVRLLANTDIFVNDPIIVPALPAAPSGDLTLVAGRSVNILADIRVTHGDLTVHANADADQGVIDAAREQGFARLFIGSDVTLNTASGDITLMLRRGIGRIRDAYRNVVIGQNAVLIGNRVEVHALPFGNSRIILATESRIRGTGDGTTILLNADYISGELDGLFPGGAGNRYLAYVKSRGFGALAYDATLASLPPDLVPGTTSGFISASPAGTLTLPPQLLVSDTEDPVQPEGGQPPQVGAPDDSVDLFWIDDGLFDIIQTLGLRFVAFDGTTLQEVRTSENARQVNRRFTETIVSNGLRGVRIFEVTTSDGAPNGGPLLVVCVGQSCAFAQGNS